MDATLRKEIRNMKADPDFVAFVMAWHGVTGAAKVPFTVEKESPAYQKKLKRWTQRDCGTKWLGYWQLIVNEWKTRRKIVLEKNLFKMEPLGPNPKHRPRNEARWSAVFDLRNYFITIDAQPHMGLLRALFYPDQLEDTFTKEWDERKSWFKDEKGAERLDKLQLFYRYNYDRIQETLRTGTPFYAKWESASYVSSSNVSH